jgi:hypothetical protein
MTQQQLHTAVARATGEPIGLIRNLGFGLVAEGADDLEPEDLALVVACPHCRRRVPFPGMAGDGALTMAECLDCDVYFYAPPDGVAVASTVCV